MDAKAWNYLKDESMKDEPVAYGLLSVIKNQNAHKVWRTLKGKYNNTGDAVDMTALECEWDEAKMSNNLEAPDIWFTPSEQPSFNSFDRTLIPTLHPSSY
jgi:hypothetical protein